MASESEYSDPSSFIERLISSRNRDLSLFLPFILGFTNGTAMVMGGGGGGGGDLENPDRELPEAPTLSSSRDRIIFINPLTQGMVVIEGRSSGLDSLLRDLLSKEGQPPASKASIEAMPCVEIKDDEEGGGTGECVICLEEWAVGDMAREMPCKHRFHGGCVEKWLKIHGSCPVCRYKMPVDEDVDFLSKFEEEEQVREEEESHNNNNNRRRRRRREIWVSFSFNGERRNGESNHQTESTDALS